MINRIKQLYKKGGVNEVFRGVNDFILYNVERGIIQTQLYSTKSLEVNNIKIEFAIEEFEDLVRASSHGEMDVLSDFGDEINEGEVVWDIGANIGSFSLVGALSGGAVEAFEPGQDALSRLNKNAELNQVCINTHNIALSDKNGTGTLCKSSRSGVRKLVSNGEGDNVSVRRGDDIDAPQPDIVKIDVEGAELEVIRGMANTLSNCRVCYVEFHNNISVGELKELMGKCYMKDEKKFDRPIIKFSSISK